MNINELLELRITFRAGKKKPGPFPRGK